MVKLLIFGQLHFRRLRGNKKSQVLYSRKDSTKVLNSENIHRIKKILLKLYFNDNFINNTLTNMYDFVHLISYFFLD